MASTLQKDLWIIKTLKNKGEMTLEEISSYWERTFYEPLNYSTFNNRKKSIQETFLIKIGYRKVDKYYVYYIDYSIPGTEEMVNALDAVDRIRNHQMSHMVGFCSMNDADICIPVPKMLDQLIEATQKHYIINISIADYLNGDDSNGHNILTRYHYFIIGHNHINGITPLGVIKANNEWYVVGTTNSGQTTRIIDARDIDGITVTGIDDNNSSDRFNAGQYVRDCVNEYYDNGQQIKCDDPDDVSAMESIISGAISVSRKKSINDGITPQYENPYIEEDCNTNEENHSFT